MNENSGYLARRTLLRRDTVTNQGRDVPVDGTLSISGQSVAWWFDEDCEYGYDIVDVYPALWNGQGAWIVHRVWRIKNPVAEREYGAQSEELLTFQVGIEYLMEHQAFVRLWKEMEPRPEIKRWKYLLTEDCANDPLLR